MKRNERNTTGGMVETLLVFLRQLTEPSFSGRYLRMLVNNISTSYILILISIEARLTLNMPL